MAKIKHKVGNSYILPPRITNPWKLIKPDKPKGPLSFYEVKIFRCFIHIGY